MSKSYFRGHEIEYRNNEFVFSDTKESTIETWQNRPCGYCGKYSTPEGHDVCLGALPNVMNACCGHGQINEAYVQFDDGVIVRSKNAERAIHVLKARRDEHV